MMCCQRTKRKRTRSEELHLGTRYLKKGISIEGPISGLISVVFTPTPYRICYGRSMREYVDGIPGVNLWLTEPYGKAIGGPICRRMQPSM